jgi:hypothetical protein
LGMLGFYYSLLLQKVHTRTRNIVRLEDELCIN